MFSKRRTVLHVDDDAQATEEVSTQLRSAGFEVETIHDPRAAMQAIARGRHRVVLLDVQMPHRSGLELLQEIKQHDAGIQVILLADLFGETSMRKAIQLGAEACFFKPLDDPRPLINALDDAGQHVERWRSTMQELLQRHAAREAAASLQPA